MYIIGKYTTSDLMSDLICDNYSILPVIHRFGIPIGFADKTIGEVCQENNVNADTFIEIVNLLLRMNDNSYRPTLDNLKVEDIVRYLKVSHEYYINQKLPSIREKLVAILSDDKISKLILKYYDDYIVQTQQHFFYEEDNVFPYIESLSDGNNSKDYYINQFSEKHDHIEEPLTEFKNIIIKYYSGGNSNEIIEVIHDILSCANDLSAHNQIEDRILVPLIRKIEQQ